MRKKLYLLLIAAAVSFSLWLSHQITESANAHISEGRRPLSMFIKQEDSEKPCYDRDRMSYTAVTDLHIHPQPFGGTSIPYQELLGYFDQTETRFALLYGIGQTLPHDGDCTYYLDCVGTPAKPSMKNDFENAANYVEYPQDKVHIGLSMTFPDLSNPESIVAGIKLLDEEYPGLFKWVGEVNLHKEALRGNGHEPASFEDIAQWKEFMAILQKRGIPIAIHSDLGTDDEPTKNLALMEEVLRLYPENKIVWMHMGLSRELVTMDAEEHIALMSEFLDKNPNLYVDISWTVIAEAYFDTAEKRDLYIEFFNRYPTRILAGTDFVAASSKNMETYHDEVEITSSILSEIDDDAFRAIALGQNYFDLAPGLNEQFEAPQICKL